MARDARTVALDFMHIWGGGIAALRQGIDEYFTSATVWENVGLNRLTGKAEALAFVDSYHAAHGLDAIHVDIVAVLADARRVMTERVDHLVRADGSAIHSTRIMGVFEIADGKIVAQRDYFCSDPSPIEPHTLHRR